MNVDEINLPLQINGKKKKTILVSRDIEEEEILKKIRDEYPDIIIGDIVKVIYLKGRIINIICK